MCVLLYTKILEPDQDKYSYSYICPFEMSKFIVLLMISMCIIYMCVAMYICTFTFVSCVFVKYNAVQLQLYVITRVDACLHV